MLASWPCVRPVHLFAGWSQATWFHVLGERWFAMIGGCASSEPATPLPSRGIEPTQMLNVSCRLLRGFECCQDNAFCSEHAPIVRSDVRARLALIWALVDDCMMLPAVAAS